MSLQIIEMTPAHIEAAIELWEGCEGMGLSDADQPETLSRFLLKNPGLSFIALDDQKLAGTCLCGTDGRRGYLYHLAIAPENRRQKIGTMLVDEVFAALHRQDIHKCHIMVYATNATGLQFWHQGGWVRRPEIVLMSRDVPLPGKEGV